MTGNNVAQTNGSSNLEIAQSNQDLLVTKGNQKKRIWIIAGVVSAVIIALIIAAIILITQHGEDGHHGNSEPLNQNAALSLEDILQGKVNPEPFNATWTSNGQLLYTDSEGNLILRTLNITNKGNDSSKILLPAHDPVLNEAYDFQISADGKYLRVAHTYRKIYRHSFRANYTIINLNNPSDRVSLNENFLDIFLVVWAPVGNAFAFVRNGNIYYKKNVHDLQIPITADALPIFNGVPDWVYEEEVFATNKALWFSPDGLKLAWARFDDRATPQMLLQIYGPPGNPQFQYPRPVPVSYPKAGAANPTVTLHFADLTTNESVNLPPPTQLASKEHILSAVSWANNATLTAIWMNRVQNEASIVAYNTSDQNQLVIIKNLEQKPVGWLELFSPPVFSKDGTKLALILSQDQGNGAGAYRHIVLFDLKANSPAEGLTKGRLVVTEILGWDQSNDQIYYLANTEQDSAVQHVYSISVQTKQRQCISCTAKSRNRQQDCLYNSAEFDATFTYYVLTCGGPDIPDVAVYAKSDNSRILQWNENKELQELERTKRMPNTKRFTFDIADGFKAHVSLKLPPDMDTSGKIKYPMLVNVYAGPDSYQVVEKFNLDWGSYLAANKSIIYATIDGRASGLKGDNILFASYRNLGTVEIIDQINVTKQIQETLPYVDASRTGIWGWSYGGYASGMILADDDEGVFKCGISVAPVTDWRYYDSIYTERFMGLPTKEDNLKGYENASLFPKVRKLRDKEYFLIHGTYDDNVHYQQSMLWARELELNDILFRQLSYPDEDHSLASVRPHLYHSLEEFLDECFAVKEP